MAKLTIEIDMEDPQEIWDALYKRIEQFGEDSAEQGKKQPQPTTAPGTYDLLLDPERGFGEVGDFFAALTTQE